MGLSGYAVDAIGREHAYRPIKGDALFIGRQATYFTPSELTEKLRSHGNVVDPSAIEIDRTTVNRIPGYGQIVTDRSIFRALGIDSIKALDTSPMKAPRSSTISMSQFRIRCVKTRISSSMDRRLITCSTPRWQLRNLAAMLKPGGRVLMINAWSPRDGSYALCSPAWYFDFFVSQRLCRLQNLCLRIGREPRQRLLARSRFHAHCGSSYSRSAARLLVAHSGCACAGGEGGRAFVVSGVSDAGTLSFRARMAAVTSIISPRLSGQLGLTLHARSGACCRARARRGRTGSSGSMATTMRGRLAEVSSRLCNWCGACDRRSDQWPRRRLNATNRSFIRRPDSIPGSSPGDRNFRDHARSTGARRGANSARIHVRAGRSIAA